MSSTTPADVGLGWDGSSDTTEVTNDLTPKQGFPVEVDGLVVLITKKIIDPQKGVILIDGDGNRYRSTGLNVIVDADSDEPEAQAGTDGFQAASAEQKDDAPEGYDGGGNGEESL